MWTIFNIFTELVAKFLLPYILFFFFLTVRHVGSKFTDHG